MHLVAPVLVRLFKVELVDIRRRAIVTLTNLIPKVQVSHAIFGLDILSIQLCNFNQNGQTLGVCI